MKLKTVTTVLLLALPFVAHAHGEMAGRAAQFQAQLDKRFAAADTNGDGRITLDEARAGMPMVARQFDSIDTGHKGYVTKDEIVAALQQRMMARNAGTGAQ
jgi:Ca2+-binding EF-hand superfamily protein